MPEISRFFGIVIRMYFSDHLRPHFHARYAEFEARFDIETTSLISGELPPRALGLVAEWASRHRPELRENWRRGRKRVPLIPIAPLE